jgi:hypothetical protein
MTSPCIRFCLLFASLTNSFSINGEKKLVTNGIRLKKNILTISLG